MVLNTIFNNISVISWWPVVLVEETRGPKEKPPTCRKSLTNLLFILASISSIPVKLYQCLKWTVAQSPNATNILFGRPKAAPNSIKSKFVSDLRQVGGFSLGPLVSSTNTTGHHDITEILLKK
jgi:hypothetical protein